MTNWDDRWMEHAATIAQWSKDPRRKVGCLIVDSDNTQLSSGFNGFPRGIADDQRLHDRETKLKIIVHAEANAVAAAARSGHPIKGATAYITRPPCSQCACLLIQAGIRRVVSPEKSDTSPRWEEDFKLAKELFLESGVVLFNT